MTQPDPATCPLCGQPNRCAMSEGSKCSDCWCAKITIDKELIARIPESAVSVACVCEDCAGGNRSSQ